jgi:hypothetical protein
MTVNSVGQRTVSLKAWDHIGNIIPDVARSDGKFPHCELKAAAYLPVLYYDRYEEDWLCIMPGKGVALDGNNDLVPAGLGISGASITYTTNDVTAGTINVTTGTAVVAGDLSGGSVTYAVSDIDGSTYDFLGVSGTAMSISAFVGYASIPIYQWAGDGGEYDDRSNPLGLRQHNYQKQHQVVFGCDYVLQIPLVPASTSTESVTFTAPTNGVSTNTGDALANLPVAKNTQRTLMVFADGGSGDSALFATQVDTAAEVTVSGYWHINLATGIITVYSGTTTPTGVTVTYYHYASAPTGSSVSCFASALGDLSPGDFVRYNVDSNYVVATPTVSGVDVNGDGFDQICGQVLQIITHPKGSLDKVQTGWTGLNTSATGALPGYTGQLDEMPGTATGGVPDKVHYAGGADKTVLINIISR